MTIPTRHRHRYRGYCRQLPHSLDDHVFLIIPILFVMLYVIVAHIYHHHSVSGHLFERDSSGNLYVNNYFRRPQMINLKYGIGDFLNIELVTESRLTSFINLEFKLVSNCDKASALETRAITVLSLIT